MSSRYKNRTAYSYVFAAFLISFVYAVVRYNVFKGVPLAHLPLYVNNKAISLASVILIGLSYLFGPLSHFIPSLKSKLSLRKFLGVSGFGLGAVHVLISLLIFNEANYGKFFTNGNLNMIGELSMLFGILGFFVFLLVTISSFMEIGKNITLKTWLKVQQLGYIAYIFIMLHVYVMGIKGWLDPSHWPGGMFPVSMVAFIVIFIVLLVKLISLLFESSK